jgi:hypothetical protein
MRKRIGIATILFLIVAAALAPALAALNRTLYADVAAAEAAADTAVSTEARAVPHWWQIDLVSIPDEFVMLFTGTVLLALASAVRRTMSPPSA